MVSINLRRLKKYKLIFSILIIGILPFILNCCLTIRISDKKAIEEFRKENIALKPTTLVINHRTIHYVSVNEDTFPTIVFLHGSPGGWIEFKDYLMDKKLIGKFRLISIDRPGFGYSDFRQALNLQAQADLLGVVLNGLQNGKPIYLVGHSYGGPLVALLAADYPKQVDGIVILAGALDPGLEPKEKWRPFFMKSPFKYLFPGAFRPSNAELWYLKTDLITLKEKLYKISCPAYVLHAKNDMLVDFRNTDYMKKEFSSSKVLIMPFEKGNHFIPDNKHRQIDSLLVSFLKQ